MAHIWYSSSMPHVDPVRKLPKIGPKAMHYSTSLEWPTSAAVDRRTALVKRYGHQPTYTECSDFVSLGGDRERQRPFVV